MMMSFLHLLSSCRHVSGRMYDNRTHPLLLSQKTQQVRDLPCCLVFIMVTMRQCYCDIPSRMVLKWLKRFKICLSFSDRFTPRFHCSDFGCLFVSILSSLYPLILTVILSLSFSLSASLSSLSLILTLSFSLSHSPSLSLSLFLPFLLPFASSFLNPSMSLSD